MTGVDAGWGVGGRQREVLEGDGSLVNVNFAFS